MFDVLIAELRANGTVRFAVRAVPGSSKTECVSVLEDESYKIRIAAPAERGKANLALIDFLAASFGVNRASVSVVSGATARHKLVRISVDR